MCQQNEDLSSLEALNISGSLLGMVSAPAQASVGNRTVPTPHLQMGKLPGSGHQGGMQRSGGQQGREALSLRGALFLQDLSKCPQMLSPEHLAH